MPVLRITCVLQNEAMSKEATGRSGIKNILRGLVLALFATFIGCAVFYTVPDFLASQLNKSLPYWFYESEVRR